MDGEMDLKHAIFQGKKFCKSQGYFLFLFLTQKPIFEKTHQNTVHTGIGLTLRVLSSEF